VTNVIRFTAVALAAALSAPQAARAADGNAAAGQKLFIQCRACHTVAAGAAHGVGPNLNGVVGTKAGSKRGYVYSSPMAKSGVVWNNASLDRFLTRPSAMVPGTKMAFAGVAAQKTRADIVAYLATLKAPRR
jgi:cytochrome c